MAMLDIIYNFVWQWLRLLEWQMRDQRHSAKVAKDKICGIFVAFHMTRKLNPSKQLVQTEAW